MLPSNSTLVLILPAGIIWNTPNPHINASANTLIPRESAAGGPLGKLDFYDTEVPEISCPIYSPVQLPSLIFLKNGIVK